MLRSAASEVTDINFFDDGTWAPIVEPEKKRDRREEDAAPNLRKGAVVTSAPSPVVKVEACSGSPDYVTEELASAAQEPDCILIDSSDDEGDEPPSKRPCAEAAADQNGDRSSLISPPVSATSTPLSPAPTPTAQTSPPSMWPSSPHTPKLSHLPSSLSPSLSSSFGRSVSHPPPLSMPSLVRMNSPPLSSPSPSSASTKYPTSVSPNRRPPRPAHSSTASPPTTRPRPAHVTSHSPSMTSLSAPTTPVGLGRSFAAQSYNHLSGGAGYPFFPPLPPPASTRSPSTTSFHSRDSLSTPPGGRVSPSVIPGFGSLHDVASGFLLSGGSADGAMNGLDLRTSSSSGSRGGVGGGNVVPTLPADFLADFANVEPFFSTHGFVALD